MLSVKLSISTKIITIALLLVVLVGCGGGRATTSSSVPSTDISQSDNTDSGTVAGTGTGTGTATLTWTPPTTYTDGSVISALGGHIIYMNDGHGFVKLLTLTNPGLSTYVVENLEPGTYWFVVTAFDVDGVESSFSNEGSVTITS